MRISAFLVACMMVVWSPRLKALAISGSEARVIFRASHIAIWRGGIILLSRRADRKSVIDIPNSAQTRS